MTFKLLLDEQMPREIARYFPENVTADHVQLVGWSGIKNGELLKLALDQSIETWLGCHRRAFEHFGGVPAVCSIDNLKAAITHACYHDPLALTASA